MLAQHHVSHTPIQPAHIFYIFTMKLLLSKETVLCLGEPACHWLKPSLSCKETAEFEPEPNPLGRHKEVEKLMLLLPCLGRGRETRTSVLRKTSPVSAGQCPWKDVISRKGKEGKRSGDATAIVDPPLGLPSSLNRVILNHSCLMELVGCHAQTLG